MVRWSSLPVRSSIVFTQIFHLSLCQTWGLVTKEGSAKLRFQGGAARRSMWGVAGRFAVRESKVKQ